MVGLKSDLQSDLQADDRAFADRPGLAYALARLTFATSITAFTGR
jgi:hypothetical protein